MGRTATATKTTERNNDRARLLRLLPKLLDEDVGFRARIAGLLSEHLTTREETNRILEEIRISREEANRRFEAMDRRFEAMDRRFDAMDRRFEAMDRRFEAMDRRFEALQVAVSTLSRSFGALGERWGLIAEGAFRAGLASIIERSYGGKVQRWLREDEEGKIFSYPAEVELDVVVRDGKPILIEVKSSASWADVDLFFRKARYYEEVTGSKPARLVLITPHPHSAAMKAAKRLGIEICTEPDRS